MNIALLDSSFTLLKYIKYINLQWTRRYYSPGQFSVQIPAEEYLDDAAYIYTADRPELGIVQKTEYRDSYDGAMVQLSGYFYEYRLNDKIAFPRYTGSGNIEDLARAIVTTYKDDIPLLQLGTANSPRLGTTITKQATGKGLATILYDMLRTQELSLRCEYDYEANTMSFKVWQGKDRTQAQNVNSFATFSGAFRNLQNEIVTIDESKAKNYAVVIGNGSYEDGNQIQVDVDLRSDPTEYKQVVYVDQTDAIYDPAEITLADYQAQLDQAGREALEGYGMIQNIKFDTVDRGLKYLVDYDLGDRCDVVLDSIERSYSVRITEVYEVFKAGQHSIRLQFGDEVPTSYQNARR